MDIGSTDLSQGQGSESSTPPSVQSSGSNAMTQDAAPRQTDERYFRQSEVNEIVKKAKYGAVEDYKRLHTEQPDYAARKYGESNFQSQAQSLQESDIRRLASDEIQRMREQWMNEEKQKYETAQAQRIVQNYQQKIAPGREKYSDFDSVTGDVKMEAFPMVVQMLADHVENPHDVLYELAKDRGKLAILENLAHASPHDAIIQAQRLAKSLKENEAASNARLPNEPLSQLRPSNTGTDNGVMSVKDYRKKYLV